MYLHHYWRPCSGSTLYHNIKRSLGKIFQVNVRLSPRATTSLPETAFIALDAKAVPVEAFGPEGEKLIELPKDLNEEVMQERGSGCGILLVTLDVESGHPVSWPIALDERLLPTPPGINSESTYYSR